MNYVHDKKLIVFGLDWHAQVSDIPAKEFANKAGAKWFWSITGNKNLGLLLTEDFGKKIKGPYSISAMLASSGASFAISFFKLADGTVAMAAIFDGFINGHFDKIITEDQVPDYLTQAREIADGQELAIITDLEIPDAEVVVATVETVFEKNAKAALTKVKLKTKRSVFGYAVLGLLLIGGYVGYEQYKLYKQEKLRIQMQKQQKNSQQLYDEEIARLKLQPAMSVSELSAVVHDVTSFPSNFQGWKLSSVDCPVTPVNEISCLVSLERHSEYAATYKDVSPSLTAMAFTDLNYNIDLKKITGKIKLKSPKLIQQGVLMDAAKQANLAKIEFASQLQDVLKITNEVNLREYQSIPLPAGVQEGDLNAPPLKQALWSIKTPIRGYSLIVPIKNDALITSVRFNISNPNSTSTLRSSFVTLEVNGIAFAK